MGVVRLSAGASEFVYLSPVKVHRGAVSHSTVHTVSLIPPSSKRGGCPRDLREKVAQVEWTRLVTLTLSGGQKDGTHGNGRQKLA